MGVFGSKKAVHKAALDAAFAAMRAAEDQVADLTKRLRDAGSEVVHLEAVANDAALAAVNGENGAEHAYQKARANLLDAEKRHTKLAHALTAAGQNLAVKQREHHQVAHKDMIELVQGFNAKAEAVAIELDAKLQETVKLYRKLLDYRYRLKMAWPVPQRPGLGLLLEAGEVENAAANHIYRFGAPSFPGGSLRGLLDGHLLQGNPSAVPSLIDVLKQANEHLLKLVSEATVPAVPKVVSERLSERPAPKDLAAPIAPEPVRRSAAEIAAEVAARGPVKTIIDPHNHLARPRTTDPIVAPVTLASKE
jgi:hypothetical protein